MLASIKTYLIITLLTMMLALGGYGYYAHGQIERLTQDVSIYRDAAATNLKAKEDADRSCVVTVDTLNAYYKNQEAIQTSQQAAGDAILHLPTLTIKDKANEAPAKSQSYSDDDRLSPDTMRLLDQAYCYGDKDHCATPAK